MNDGTDSKAAETGAYNVVFRTLEGYSKGAMFFTPYANRAAFEESNKGIMQDGTNRPLSEVYAVVAQGISDGEVKRIIHSRENAADVALMRSLHRTESSLKQIISKFQR